MTTTFVELSNGEPVSYFTVDGNSFVDGTVPQNYPIIPDMFVSLEQQFLNYLRSTANSIDTYQNNAGLAIALSPYDQGRLDALKQIHVPAKGDRDAYSYTRDVGNKPEVRPDLRGAAGNRLNSRHFLDGENFMRIKADPAEMQAAEARRQKGENVNSVYPVTLNNRPYLYKPAHGLYYGATSYMEAANEVLASSIAQTVGIPSQRSQLVPRSLDNMRSDLHAPAVLIEGIVGCKQLIKQTGYPATLLPSNPNDYPQAYLRQMLSHPDLTKIAAFHAFTLNMDGHPGNILVGNDPSGNPKYQGKRYYAIDNEHAYTPLLGATPYDAIIKGLTDIQPDLKGDRVLKENLKLYGNTLEYLCREYPVKKLQVQAAQLHTAANPYDPEPGEPTMDFRREIDSLKAIAGAHKGAQKVVSVIKSLGVR